MCLLAIPANAKQTPSHLDATTSFNGTCETFTVTRGSDVTDIDCDTKMLQTHWTDGRRGFYFMSHETNKKALVTTFSGMESGSIFLDESSDIVQPIDTLVSMNLKCIGSKPLESAIYPIKGSRLIQSNVQQS